MEDSEGFAGDFAGSGLNTEGTEDTERFARDFAEMAKCMNTIHPYLYSKALTKAKLCLPRTKRTHLSIELCELPALRVLIPKNHLLFLFLNLEISLCRPYAH